MEFVRNSGHKKGRGVENPGGKVSWALHRRGVSLAQSTTVTMTPNNKAVKGCGWLPFLFTVNPRRVLLGNPGVPCTGDQQHDAFVLRCFRRGRTKTRRWVLLTSSTAGSRFFNRGPATNGCRPCRTPPEGNPNLFYS